MADVATAPFPQSRSEAFGQGMADTAPKPATTVQQNIAPGYQARSIQDQLGLSPNGLGTQDAGRKLLGGGMLPTSNGMSQDTYERARAFLSPSMSY